MLLYFIHQIVLSLTIGTFYWLTPVSLWHTTIIVDFLSTYLLFGPVRYSSLYLHISCPIPKISHFFWELWFILMMKSIRNQDLSTRYTCCYWNIFASWSFHWLGKEIYVCILTYVYLEIFLYETSVSILS